MQPTWGGDLHSSADSFSSRYSSQGTRSADADISLPSHPLVRGRLGDERGFIHKRIFGGIKGAIGGILTGNPLAGLAGGIKGFLKDPAQVVPQATRCPPGFFVSAAGQCTPVGGLPPSPRFGGPPPRLPPPIILQPPPPTGGLLTPLSARGALAPGQMGEAVLGQFGAGTEPEVFDTMVRRCPRKAVLGADGVCYNRGDLRNSDRWWPRGRRPLLTGGDMRAISTASSAAKKLQRKQKQLQQLGLLKKPAARSRPAPPGHRVHLHHDGSGHE